MFHYFRTSHNLAKCLYISSVPYFCNSDGSTLLSCLTSFQSRFIGEPLTVSVPIGSLFYFPLEAVLPIFLYFDVTNSLLFSVIVIYFFRTKVCFFLYLILSTSVLVVMVVFFLLFINVRPYLYIPLR